MPQQVTLRTPGGVWVDPVSGNERPFPAVTETSPAYLALRPVGQVSTGAEVAAGQDTLTEVWTLLVPPQAMVTSKTEVIDDQGRVFRVAGPVADRPAHDPQFRAAALRLVSDLQTP